MKRKILLILLSLSFVFGQEYNSRKRSSDDRMPGKPPIYYNIFKYFSRDHSKPYATFVLFVQYDIMQFNKTEQGFTAAYEVTLNFRSKEKKEAFLEKIWQERVDENDFLKTNSKNAYHSAAVEIDISGLPADEYLLYLEVKDKNSEKEFKRQIEFVISENVVADKLTEITLLEKNRFVPVEIPLTEEREAVDFNILFRSYFELAVPRQDSIIISSRLLSKRKSKETLLQEKRYSYYSDSDIFVFEEPFPPDLIKEGQYIWQYQVSYSKKKFKIQKSINILWFDKPYSLYDIDKAVEPMVYILPEDEWKSVKKKSGRKLQEWFDAFWNDRNVKDETPLNEMMYQFYLRVDYANMKFHAGNKQGWKTDRGRSYILYGQPDTIESKKHKVGSAPYEIWIYKKINQKLTFIDSKKDNTYELVSIEELEVAEDE